VDADHSYGRIYRKGSISVSIVTHSDCAIKPKMDPGANIAKLMKLRDDL